MKIVKIYQETCIVDAQAPVNSTNQISTISELLAEIQENGRSPPPALSMPDARMNTPSLA